MNRQWLSVPSDTSVSLLLWLALGTLGCVVLGYVLTDIVDLLGVEAEVQP